MQLRNAALGLCAFFICAGLVRLATPKEAAPSSAFTSFMQKTNAALESQAATIREQAAQLAELRNNNNNNNNNAHTPPSTPPPPTTSTLASLTASVKALQLSQLHDKWLLLSKDRPERVRALTNARSAYETKNTTEAEHTYLRAGGALAGLDVTLQRMLDDMRELSHPGYRRARNEAETFIPVDPKGNLSIPLEPGYTAVNLSDASLQYFLKSGVHFNYNEYGVWGWKEGARHRDSYLVVIGAEGVPEETVTLLLEAGFVVWKRLYPCPGWCREAVTYLSYLADDSHPSKPLPQQVIFIHGHNASWHQTDSLLGELMDSIKCAETTQRYTPLGWLGQTTEHEIWGNHNDRFGKQYVENFGMLKMPRTTRFIGWCCAQFVVSRALIEANSQTFYNTFLEKKIELKLDAYRYEFYYHYMFGEDEVSDAAHGPPKACQPSRTATKPFTATSRTGEWTADNAEVTIILGERSADEEQSMAVVDSILKLKPEVNVWRRHTNYWCSASQWSGEGCCARHRGYLDFLNDASSFPQSKVYLFVRGNVPFTAESLDTVMATAECAQKRGRYTPLNNKAEMHEKSSVQMALRFLQNKDKTYIPSGGLRGYKGEEFAVPSAVLQNRRVQPLLDAYETYNVGCMYWKLPAHNLGHFWHWMFGEDNEMRKCTEDAPLCANCEKKG